MKKVKRIIAVLLLTVAIIVVGYLCFTGSRLHSNTEQTDTEVSYVQESVQY